MFIINHESMHHYKGLEMTIHQCGVRKKMAHAKVPVFLFGLPDHLQETRYNFLSGLSTSFSLVWLTVFLPLLKDPVNRSHKFVR